MAVRRFLGDTTARVLGAVYVVLVGVGLVFGHLARPAMPWLATNVILAAIAPVAAAFLSVARRRGIVWWGAAAATLVVLPNTPYVLTDIIHFREDRWIAAAWGVRPWVVPLGYAVVVAIGVCGYAYVLARLVAGVRRRHSRFVAAVVAGIVNAFCAAGVWLGRVRRLNSWDVTHPGLLKAALHHAASMRALAEMGVVFVGAGAAAAALVLLVAGLSGRASPAHR